jgi:predicted anti-sigma-YlaC factor YlaD
MLSCAEVVQLVTDYVEGQLVSADRLRFEEHVGICPPCRGFLSQMRVTRRVVSSVAEEPLTPELEQALVDAFHDWTRPK